MHNLSNEEQLDILKRSLNSIPQGILITDCQQKDDPIIYTNEFFLSMSGYHVNEVIGKNCRFMQGETTVPTALQKLAIAVQNRQSVTIEMINYRKNGESFLNEFTVCPVKNANDVVTHCIAIEKEL